MLFHERYYFLFFFTKSDILKTIPIFGTLRNIIFECFFVTFYFARRPGGLVRKFYPTILRQSEAKQSQLLFLQLRFFKCFLFLFLFLFMFCLFFKSLFSFPLCLLTNQIIGVSKNAQLQRC